jgi:AraC-like DNA-binding protein
VDNGYASQMVSQLVGKFGITVGPISATGVINAPTLADAIQLIRRILVAGNPHSDIVVCRRPDDFEIVFKSCLPDGSLREFYAAAMLVFVACCIIRYAPESQRSLQFDFDFAAEQGIVETIAAISSRVETQAATPRIVGRSQWLDMPSTAFDRSMWQLSLDRVQSMEADGLPADLEQRVRRYIKLSLAQEKRPPRLKQVAALEGVSERTMLRMLADNGLSFHLISEDVRRSLAGEMINLPSVSLSEIAESLGFTDLSSFSRSFRKWFGATPGQYRKSLEG